jgi:serine/threonine protein kinase
LFFGLNSVAIISSIGNNDTTSQIPIGGRVGTREYAAPEVLNGIGVDGRPADVFSCGATVHTMLCLAPPWRVALPGDVHYPFWERFCADPASQAHHQFWQGKQATSENARELMRRLMRNHPAHRLTAHETNQFLDAMGNANMTYVLIASVK